MKRKFMWVAGLALAGGVETRAGAVSTVEWKLQTADDFRAGKLEGVVVSSLGEVTAGPGVEGKKLGEEAVWSLARVAPGVVYLGTGNAGNLYKWESGKVVLAHKTGQTAIVSLVADGAGGAYAGTIPDGRIYKIAQGGAVSEFAKLEAKYVWSLAYEATSRTLYAGTGPKGKVFRVNDGGKASLFLDTKDAQVLALQWEGGGDGVLYVGTSGKGLLLKVSKAGKATVVADLGGDEVRALAVQSGVVFAAVNEFQRKGYAPPGLPLFGGTFATPPIAGGALGGMAARVQPPQAFPRDTGTGSLYRVEGEGRIEKLLSLPRGFFTAIEVDSEGSVYAAMGEEGRVFRVTPEKIVQSVFDLKEKHVLAISIAGGEPRLLATGNAAAVYQVAGPKAAKSRLTSPVYDSKFVSRWGVIDYRATGKVAIRTRSGNSKKPDETWAVWSPKVTEAGKITSPPARYLQLRVEFNDANAVLRQVRVFLLPQNQRARLTEITVDGIGSVSPPVVVPQLPGGMPLGGMVMHARPSLSGLLIVAPLGPPRKNTQKRLAWKVENPDNDPLVYSVFVREEASQNWIQLNRKGPISEMWHSWDTESFPDGWYRVKVVASDERANPPGLVLTHEWVSHSVLVDNREPEIVDLSVDSELTVKGIARDNFSTVQRLEYSLDGGDWVVVFPEGELHDATAVRFKFKLPRPATGAHTLHVRALDAASNVGVASQIFVVK